MPAYKHDQLITADAISRDRKDNKKQTFSGSSQAKIFGIRVQYKCGTICYQQFRTFAWHIHHITTAGRCFRAC